MTAAIDSLPRPEDAHGNSRRVGIEVECGGLGERDLAHLLADRFGGMERQTGDFQWRVEGSRLGRIEIMLDTGLRDHAESKLAQMGLDLGRSVIPVEYVTEPILPEDIALLDDMNLRLAEAGALGTQDGIALGFGLHLNIALPDLSIDAILPVLRTFALVEACLRDRMQIDPSRRLLPFIDPMPAALTDALCDPAADQWSTDDLAGAYLEHAPSRNHALDVLPILKELDADRVVKAVPAMADKSARPAWHYRLPDCRIDDHDWSIALEWNRWCAVERIAADQRLSDRLRAAWREHRDSGIRLPNRWMKVSSEILQDAGALP